MNTLFFSLSLCGDSNGLFRPYDTHVLSMFSFHFLLVKALETHSFLHLFLNHIAAVQMKSIARDANLRTPMTMRAENVIKDQ